MNTVKETNEKNGTGLVIKPEFTCHSGLASCQPSCYRKMPLFDAAARREVIETVLSARKSGRTLMN
jgi:hypothetical protein